MGGEISQEHDIVASGARGTSHGREVYGGLGVMESLSCSVTTPQVKESASEGVGDTRAAHLSGAVTQAAADVGGGAKGLGGVLAGLTATLACGRPCLGEFLGGALVYLGGLGGGVRRGGLRGGEGTRSLGGLGGGSRGTRPRCGTATGGSRGLVSLGLGDIRTWGESALGPGGDPRARGGGGRGSGGLKISPRFFPRPYSARAPGVRPRVLDGRGGGGGGGVLVPWPGEEGGR